MFLYVLHNGFSILLPLTSFPFKTSSARFSFSADNLPDGSFYLRQGGYVFARLCLSVCLCVSKITQKNMDGSF